MKEFVETLICRLEEYQENNTFCKSEDDYELGIFYTCEKAIEIVNQLAEEYKPKTNAGKIRNMSDEELADFLEEFEACDVCKYLDNNRCTFENPCVHEFAGAMIYDWLQSEVKGSDVDGKI